MQVFGIILLVYIIGAWWYFWVICRWLWKGTIDRRYANPVALLINMLVWPYALFMWLFKRNKQDNEPEEKEEQDDNNKISSR